MILQGTTNFYTSGAPVDHTGPAHAMPRRFMNRIINFQWFGYDFVNWHRRSCWIENLIKLTDGSMGRLHI